MFTFVYVELIYWDFWKRIKLPMDDNNIIIVGRNGSGKTTLLDAIRVLLGISTTKRRHFRRYASRSKAPHSWIIGVVRNEKVGTRRPFAPHINTDRVTLACKIERKDNTWEREYYIRAGEVSYEEFIANPGPSLGPGKYAEELRYAGLTRSVTKVLSLEQGTTSKLCELSPKELLTLVYEVYEDADTLRNYEDAKLHQKSAEEELRATDMDIQKLKGKMMEMRNRVESFERFKKYKNELQKLETEYSALGQYIAALEKIEGVKRNLRGDNAQLKYLVGHIKILRNEKEQLEKKIKDMQDERKTLDTEIKAQNEQLGALREERGGISQALQRIQDLEERCGDIPLIDTDALRAEIDTLMDKKATLAAERAPLQDTFNNNNETIRQLNAGVLRPDASVEQFSGALKSADIPHGFLYEGVEVKVEKWRLAIESILKGFRYVVSLHNKKDETKAYSLGSKHKYPHFVVPDAGNVSGISVRKDSALSVVKLEKYVPEWIRRHLNEISLVDNVEDGMKLKDGSVFVTMDGYMKERRGGRYIGVSAGSFVFGAAARKKQLEELNRQNATLKKQIDRIDREIASFQKKITEGLETIQQQESARTYREEKERKPSLQAKLEEVNGSIDELSENRRRAQNRIDDLGEDIEEFQPQLGSASAELKSKEGENNTIKTRFEDMKRQYREMIKEYIRNAHILPPQLKTEEAIAKFQADYGNMQGLETAKKVLKNNIESENLEKDPSVVEMMDKLNSDYQATMENFAQREQEVTRTRHEVDRASKEYIKVLNATVRHYEKSLKQLAELAGVDILIEKPTLESEEGLNTAGLAIKWSFDGKDFHYTDDPEFSGGQEVIQSLILLIALMKDDKGGRGFVAIDEPFAHLDISNIDKVADFMKSTETQFIITSPSTHNANVFRAIGLSINTYKKKPGETFAPLPTHCRRQNAA